MRLRELRIKNFRNIVDVCTPINDTTILVGENNSGKTAFLDALRIALPRTGFGRSNPFNEYDYHMSNPDESPQTSDGISIELWFREDHTGEWPATIIRSLSEIIQTDPEKDINSIGLRINSKYDNATTQYSFNREFLNLKREPLSGKSQSPALLSRFLDYVRLFYLSALRDSDAEFSPRSQFWGRILRDLKIDAAKQKELFEELNKLNEVILTSDPRLNQIRSTLQNIQKVISAGGTLSIQSLPLRSWDLIAKSQVMISPQNANIDLPLSKHGQGIQSLAVLFLFQAYIDVLLRPEFHKETEALLALEEPEAHLHPHAIRALTNTIDQIGTQKIISTHSPYVLQDMPITNIRLFRRAGAACRIVHIKREFAAPIPNNPELISFCSASGGKYDYDVSRGVLFVKDRMHESEYRKLLPIYASAKEAQAELKKLKEESQQYISDDDIVALDTYAKRIRGEIFFAQAWLLCEGQSEYLLLHYFAELIGQPLDRVGVSIVDYQNNGSPGAFVLLANNLEIEWILLCDNDEEGNKYINSIKKLVNITGEKEKDLLRALPEKGADFEMFLVKNGFHEKYEAILSGKGIKLTRKCGDAGYDEELANNIRKNKTECTNELIRISRESGATSDQVPVFFANAIKDIIAKAKR